jgi:hypothetical protein
MAVWQGVISDSVERGDKVANCGDENCMQISNPERRKK